MFRCTSLLFTACALCCFTRATQAQLAVSAFDNDRDGWLSKPLTFLNSGAPPVVLATYTPTWSVAGGNPGGYVTQSDPDGDTSYWYAPAKFLGNQSTAYRGSLSFDLIQTSANGSLFNQEDVILVGNGLTLTYDTPVNPTITWMYYDVGLTEAAWRKNSLSGPAATQAEMQSVLASLSGLYIRGEFINGSDVDGIDNVTLTAGPAVVPEPGALALLTGTAVFGASLLLRRQKQTRCFRKPVVFNH